MKLYLNIITPILIIFASLAYGQANISAEAKQYGAQILDSYKNQPSQNYDFLKSLPEQDNTVTQSQKAFKNNDNLESQLLQIKTPDNEAVIYAKKSKKPAINSSDFSEILSPKTENFDPKDFYFSEEKSAEYDPADMSETLTHFAAMKSISEPMKDGLEGVGQSTNPTVMHGNCQRCTITLGSAFKDCCDLNGIAKGLLGGCRQEEKQLANASVKDKRCVLIQSKYCTKRKLRVCVEKKSAYCCYGSEMGKIIQEIAHHQLAISWGDGKTPNCTSLTAEQLSRLDFNTPFARAKLAALVSEHQGIGTNNANQIKHKVAELQAKLNNQYKNPVTRLRK